LVLDSVELVGDIERGQGKQLHGVLSRPVAPDLPHPLLHVTRELSHVLGRCLGPYRVFLSEDFDVDAVLLGHRSRLTDPACQAPSGYCQPAAVRPCAPAASSAAHAAPPPRRPAWRRAHHAPAGARRSPRRHASLTSRARPLAPPGLRPSAASYL